MPAGSQMRAAVASDEVMILFYDNLAQLAASFEKFAEEHAEDDDGLSADAGDPADVPRGSMNIKEFTAFANDAGE